MVPEKCQHPKRVRGVVELDFSRPDAPDHLVYSRAGTVAGCEDCGHAELYAKFHHELCDWLRKS